MKPKMGLDADVESAKESLLTHPLRAGLSKSEALTRSLTMGSPTSSNLKWVSLVVLIAQTTALVLLLRYSRTQKSEGPRYVSSTAVVTAEIIKFFTCVVVLFVQHGWRWVGVRQELQRDAFDRPYDTLKVAVPAILYVLQNNLLFFALSKLDAATYQVTYQLKILTTAFFSVTMMKKSLNPLKWVALVLLTAGVALVQVLLFSDSKNVLQLPSGDDKKTAVDDEKAGTAKLLGLGAVVLACFSSGYAGVFFERILKTSSISLWMRNLQLAFFSIPGGFFMVYAYDSEAVNRDGFFQGYNNLIWMVVLLQAYGGLLIALVVKYADNILKGFAVSLSIIISSICSWLILDDFVPSLAFGVGAGVVIASTFLYGFEPKPAPTIPHSA